MASRPQDPNASTESPPPEARRRKAGCFKTGCLGCLGLGAVVISVLVIMVLVALIQGPPERRPESTALTRALPGVSEAPDVPLESIGVGGTGTEGPERASGGQAPSIRPGRIELDLSMGTFEIVPGPAGQPLRVEADYDAGTYELTEEYEPDGRDGWTYRLSFGSRVSLFRQILGGADRPDPGNNKIRLIVPRDVPVAVGGRVGVGESRIDLGGLWLTDVALRFTLGSHRVDFNEPTREPVDSVDISMSIGECAVRLPDESVALDVGRLTLMIGESHTRDLDRRASPPPGAPTVRLDVSQTLGELHLAD